MNRLLALVATLGVTAFATASHAQTVLRFNLWVPPTHHTHAKIMMPWAADVAKATGGRVKVEFTAASLGAPARQFDLAGEGLADVTFGDHTYTPGRFVITKMVELPFTGDHAEALSVALWRTYSPLPEAEKEHRGVKLLGMFTTGIVSVLTSKKKIDSIEALRGTKLRVGGEMSSRVFKELGAVPVAAPATQVFDLVSQGVVDGAAFNIDAYKNFRLDRFMKLATVVPEGFYNTSFFLVMNRNRWDSLPKQDQDAIWKVSAEPFARHAGRIWDEEAQISIAAMKENNVELTILGPKEKAQMAAKLANLRTEWIAEVKKAYGLDGEKLLATLQREYQANKK